MINDSFSSKETNKKQKELDDNDSDMKDNSVKKRKYNIGQAKLPTSL